MISVGGSTEAEMKQTKARVEDALHATRRRPRKALLPGGGVALLRCRAGGREGPRRQGRREGRRGHHLCGRCPAPIKQIAQNSGVDGSVVADEVSQKAENIGYDAYTGKYVDMFKAGIIDRLKVVRTALQNAASIAGLMLTTETLMTDLEKDDKKSGGRGRSPLIRGGGTCRRGNEIQRGPPPTGVAPLFLRTREQGTCANWPYLDRVIG